MSSNFEPKVSIKEITGPNGEKLYELDVDPETFSVLQCIAERCDPNDDYFAEFRKALLPEDRGGACQYPFELFGARYVVVDSNNVEFTDFIRVVR